MIKMICILVFLFSINFNGFIENLQKISVKIETEKILIINCFDASKIKTRSKKRDLLADLTDSLKVYLERRIMESSVNEVMVIPGTIVDSSERNITTLMTEHHAEKAIVIRSIDAYFNQSSDRIAEDEEGKTIHILSYDLCTKVNYMLFNKHGEKESFENNICDFFTDRTARGAFVITFGPDIVGKRKHTFESIRHNGSQFLSSFAEKLKIRY